MTVRDNVCSTIGWKNEATGLRGGSEGRVIMAEVFKNWFPVRACAFAVAGSGTLFWLYTFYAIAQLPQGDGSGMQWVAIMPLGMIFLILTLPALVLSWKGRRLWLALTLGTASLVAFALLWRQLLGEFYGSA